MTEKTIVNEGEQVDYTINNPDVITKYKTAAEITVRVLQQLKKKAVDGAKIIDLCIETDKDIEKETAAVFNKGKIQKGIGFPTSISVNNCVCHFSPLPSDPEASQTLKEGDLVKVELGAQIDGFASIIADTFVIGASKEKPVTGRVADVVKAAHLASEAAIRLIKPGGKNWEVTDIISKIAKDFDCTPVENMLTHQQERDVIDGKKQIILNPSEANRRDFETFTFEEGEVYGVDIVISTSSDGKARKENARTTIFKKNKYANYSLKMKTSRSTLTEIQKRFGSFPFTLRAMEDEKKARMGVQEPQTHGLLTPYDVLYEKDGEFVAQFLFTVALTKNGTLKLSSSSSYDSEIIKSEKEIKDQAILDLLATSVSRKKNKKKTKKVGEPNGTEETQE